MNNKPYYSANEYYKELYGEKVYKISLNGGMSCPNRDGTIGLGGCIFCSEGGSGDFAAAPTLSITEQIDEAIGRIRSKYSGSKFIAYFQAFTNTYASVDYLEKIFSEAINNPAVAGLSIATRPDCLEQDKIDLLARLNLTKPVWVELGLQTANERTAVLIKRGYTNDIFEDAVDRLHRAGLKVITHMIIGLPGESLCDYENTVKYIANLNIHGVKLQLLHVLKNTALCEMYYRGEFSTLDQNEYIDIIVKLVELLPPHTVIYRLTGDGPRSILIAPEWSTDKKNTLNMIIRRFAERETYQGKEWRKWQ